MVCMYPNPVLYITNSTYPFFECNRSFPLGTEVKGIFATKEVAAQARKDWTPDTLTAERVIYAGD